MKEQLIWVLTLLVTLFGRVPRIGPALQLLLLIVTQYWPELEAIIKKTPAAKQTAVTTDPGRRTRAKVKAALLNRCRAVGDD